MGLRFVTLDATGTLFHCPRLGEIYASVLERHGIDVEPKRAAELVRQVWLEFDCAQADNRDRFTGHPDGARGWWKRFLDRFCEHLGGPPASPFAAAELYDRFAKPESWELYADALPFLESVKASDLGVAVVSNWDERLPDLLEGLGLARHLREVVYSAQVGFEKPHPGIFESALAVLSAEPAEVLHVGDSRRRDLEGAEAIGMKAVLLGRRGKGDVRGLEEVPELLERLCYVAG